MTRTEILDEKEPVNGDSTEVSGIPERASIVQEEKAQQLDTIPTANGTRQETDRTTDPELYVVENKEELKFNGNGVDIESSKNEVKFRNENLPNQSQVSTELPLKSLPPPLPITPQPSQVMVFALNDNNGQQESIEHKLPSKDFNVTPQLHIPSLIKTAPAPEVVNKEEIKTDSFNATLFERELMVNKDQPVSATAAVEETDKKFEDINPFEGTVNSTIKILADSQLMFTTDEKLEIFQENINYFDDKDMVIQNFQSQEEQGLQSLEEKEKVAETLVEQITQTAVEIVEKQSNNDNFPFPELREPTIELNGSCTHTNSKTILDEHSILKVNT